MRLQSLKTAVCGGKAVLALQNKKGAGERGQACSGDEMLMVVWLAWQHPTKRSNVLAPGP